MKHLRRLSSETLLRCPELLSWLDQFPPQDQAIAAEMLRRLRFVSLDLYSAWLNAALSKFQSNPAAVFAVRKLQKDVKCLWDDKGRVAERPASSLGSEDFVQSIIANV